jgi:hypothetical protein
MRLLRLRPFASAACGASIAMAALLGACAKGTDSGTLDEGGIVDEDAARDVNVIPIPRDSATDPDSPILPPDDSGSSGGCVGKVVINEVQTHGTASALVEFIELFNPNTCAVPMGNWDIGYKSAAGNGSGVVYTFGAGDSIPASSYFVLGSATYAGTKNATFAAGFSGMADDGQIALRDDAAKVVDAVGFGTAAGPFVEKSAAPGQAAGSSVGRSPNGADTDNNNTDFKTYATPSPGAANP